MGGGRWAVGGEIFAFQAGAWGGGSAGRYPRRQDLRQQSSRGREKWGTQPRDCHKNKLSGAAQRPGGGNLPVSVCLSVCMSGNRFKCVCTHTKSTLLFTPCRKSPGQKKEQEITENGPSRRGFYF